MSAASRANASRARGAVRPIARDLRRPGVAELVGVGIATLVLLGAAIAGLSNATGRPVDAGVSIALTSTEDGRARISVQNGGSTPFHGRVQIAGRSAQEIDVAPGTATALDIAVPRDCSGPVAVTLEGQGAPAEPVELPCPGASS